jgi:uncharacterized protein (TIGR03118 family)
MSNITGRISLAAAIAAVLTIGCGGSSSSSGGTSGNGSSIAFTQTNLVADTQGGATNTDANLVNPWGVSYAPGGPFWVSDNGTGVSTLYNGSGAMQSLVVQIPAATGGKGPVTGQVYNGTGGFVIPGQGSALFIFDSEDGAITAWNGQTGTAAVKVADESASGAVYTGLALGTNGGANYLYATNFNSGKVDVFDTNFTLIQSFSDSGIPAGYAPFNIANIGGNLYVTFAKQNATKNGAAAGAGTGYVDVFNPAGTLNGRLVSQGALNAPWGLALAPTGFGSFGGDLLVGNLGDGHINAYNLSSGASAGAMQNGSGQAIAIDGLWALIFGNGGTGGSTGTLYFTAGPSQYSHGLFGSLTPKS